ncbi:MAG TPA: hypothetical protein VFS43_24695 [Polyangiaceae bacterium]|nr:hypothetical protein [Polyangiaceae bacterium]
MNLALGALALGALLAACGAQPDAGPEASTTDEAIAAGDAFCPQGFAFDAGHQLCLSATEAAGPFAPSMIDFCRQWVPNRADGSNACQTNEWGFPATRWARSLAIDARLATKQADGCPRGTTFNAGQGYCSDGQNLYGPFTKDDVFFCQTAGGGGAACETNRVAVGMARPKSVGPVPGGISAEGKAQMSRIVAYADAHHSGVSGGRCFEYVWDYLWRSGYGKIDEYNDAPDMPSAYARNFAEYMNQGNNAATWGLQRLPINNPYDAPVGAVVVVAAGSPGTAHPTAGDIAIAAGGGRFINDGPNMGYGGSRQAFVNGGGKVLGIYAPL